MSKTLEPPTGNPLAIWNILLSWYPLPLVAVADEMGVFSALDEAPLSIEEAATRFELTNEWAEILLGTLAALDMARLQMAVFG